MPVTVTPSNVRAYLDVALANDATGLSDNTVNLPGYAGRALTYVESRVTVGQFEDEGNEDRLSLAADLLTASYLALSTPTLLGVFYQANAPGSAPPTGWKAKAEELRKRAEEELEAVRGEDEVVEPAGELRSASVSNAATF